MQGPRSLSQPGEGWGLVFVSWQPLVRHGGEVMAKSLRGPNGLANRHHSDGCGRAADDPGQPLACHARDGEPQTLEAWQELYELVEKLPADLREVFDLLAFQHRGGPGERSGPVVGRVPARPARVTIHRVAGEDRLSAGQDDLIGRCRRHLRPLDGAPIGELADLMSSTARRKASSPGPTNIDSDVCSDGGI